MASNSDYTKKRTNLNDLIPHINKSKLVESINENLFNRFLTKNETVRTIGNIGDDDLSGVASYKIKEVDEYRTKNQLQPIATYKSGTKTEYMSFQDLLTNLEMMGVDVQNYDRWGALQQFNWLPPIDFDKLINYRNYFWNDSRNVPEYITIKSYKTFAESRFNQSCSSLFDNLNTYKVHSNMADSIQIEGDLRESYVIGDRIILDMNDGSYVICELLDVQYSIGSKRTTLTVDKPISVNTVGMVVNTMVSVYSIDALTSTIKLTGNYTDLFVKDYVFSVQDLGVNILLKIVTSSYDAVTNKTTLSFTGAPSFSSVISKINLSPIVYALYGEKLYFSEQTNVISPALWDISDISKIWFKRQKLCDGNQGFTYLNFFNDINNDFNANDVHPDDVVIILNGPYTGEYSISEVQQTGLKVDYSGKFANVSGLSYVVARKRSIITQTNSNLNLEIKLDYGTDSLQQYDGTQWNTVLKNVSLLLDLLHGRYLIEISQIDDWSKANKWIHKDQVKDMTDKSRAQIPIIEFDPFIELSNTSIARHAWSYKKDEESSYLNSSISPKLIEIHDISIKNGDEFYFDDYYTIIFHEKYGSLLDGCSPGDKIKLIGFEENNGVYTIANSSFEKQSPTGRYVTKLTLVEKLQDTSDLDIGCRVGPYKTSFGDIWLGYTQNHWRFDGIENINASSYFWTLNPMTTDFISLFNGSNFSGVLYGLAQDCIVNYEVTAPLIELHASLQSVVLHDDYQEGDLRVYINGIRQYGNFSDIQSTIDGDYVGAILFDSSVTLTPTDLLRIEVGENFLEDCGRRDVTVWSNETYEKYNLTRLRIVEQRKFTKNVYPMFRLFNSDLTPAETSCEIFKYAESSSMPVNPYILKRIVFDYIDRDFSFENLLHSENQPLYNYNNLLESRNHTVWQPGVNNEESLPVKVGDSWDISDSWYYNIEHDNRKTVNLTEIVRHATSFIDSQDKSPLFSSKNSRFYLLDKINPVLGGTIKEHNHGLDSLASAVFSNTGNPVDVIAFAANAYNMTLNFAKDLFLNNFISIVNDTASSTLDNCKSFATSYVIDLIENNDKYGEWVGDSTNVSIKNIIPSVAGLGLIPKVYPHKFKNDVGGYTIIHHDGHYSSINIESAQKELLIKKFVTPLTQTVNSSSEAFPTINTAGLILIRTDMEALTRKIYKSSPLLTWFELDLNDLLSSVILNIEINLYNDCITNQNVYDFSNSQNLDNYQDFMEERFKAFCQIMGIETPLSNSKIFRSNDPFTWNYFYSPLNNHPLTNAPDSNTFGCWQALYEYVYGTAYPNMQPWFLQGYTDKPSWWDDTYLNDDVLINRYWKASMWTNILNGSVPVGEILPDGNISTGDHNETITYSYLPVNIESTSTFDGYAPDALLPPYWNSANTINSSIRTLFDVASNENVTTPNLDFEFNQDGMVEWMWKKSIYKSYDDLITEFRLNPIKMFNSTFDDSFYTVNCLLIDKKLNKVRNHRDMYLHGEIVDGETHKALGIGQWYAFFNRYSGIDGNVSAYSNKWKDWTQKLSYLFGGMIDVSNITVFNYNFDITDKDYTIDIKKSVNYKKKEMTGFNAKLLSVPSKYSRTRDNGIGWTIELNSITENSSIGIYQPECFEFQIDTNNNICNIGRYPLTSAHIDVPLGIQFVNFNQKLTNGKSTGLLNANYAYTASITFDSINTINISLAGYKIQTISKLIDEINTLISDYGVCELNAGNLVFKSNTIAGSTNVNIVDGNLFNSITDYFYIETSATQSYKFNKIFEVYGNVSSKFTSRSKFTIADSTNYNGEYTVLTSVYDVTSLTTKIFVLEDVTINNPVVDGYLIHNSTRSLPEEWITGTEVFIDSTGILPTPLDQFTPYYIVRLDDYSFRLALTAEKAALDNTIILNGTGVGIHSVGRLKATFTALAGAAITYPWRVYQDDKREVYNITLPIQISGLQNLVNIVKGYESKLFDDGIEFKNIDGDNANNVYDRVDNWQLAIEEFITWAYKIKAIKQEDRLKFRIGVNLSDNTFELKDNATINWATGTQLVFLKDDNAELPNPLNNPLSEYIPYYLIRNQTNDRFQIAISSYDANKGNAIDITSVGVGDFYIQAYTSLTNYPEYRLNPAKNMLWVRHEDGIISDVFDNSEKYFTQRSKIYDSFGDALNNASLMIYRQDKETKISLLKSIIQNNQKTFQYTKRKNTNGLEKTSVVIANDIINIGGIRLFLDSYEHILSFNNSGVDGSLIFDSFFGIRTPRFYLDFSKGLNFSLRPNIGGHVLSDGAITDNLENSVENIRYLYDTYNAIEKKPIIERGRKSIGYDGPRDYMDDLKINDKSQFIFWRGMIQNKGTNTAIKAFANQPIFESADVDEFWAYRVACFGDNKEKSYPEMKLFTRDVSSKEMRVEFVTPDGAVIDQTFEPIKLVDENRWWNQPDYLYSATNKASFFFNSKIVAKEEEVAGRIQIINGRMIFNLPVHGDGVIITYYDPLISKTLEISENINYRLINGRIVEFFNTDTIQPQSLNELKIYVLSYDYDAQTPGTIVDKKSGTIVTKVPIWNPALGQNYHVSEAVIDYKSNSDVATYNFETLAPDNSTWLESKVGTTWMDNTWLEYIPYYDSRIMTDINERIFNWGKLADYSDFDIYEWTESLVPPQEWATKVIQDASNKNLLQNNKRSGEAYNLIYKNKQDVPGGQPLWVPLKDLIQTFEVSLVSVGTIPDSFFMNGEVEAYVNGVYKGTFDIDFISIHAYCYGDLVEGQTEKPNFQDRLTLIKRVYKPTETELADKTRYKREYPYSYVTKLDPISKKEYNVYYFWVKNKDNLIPITGDTNITLRKAKEFFKNIPIPYMILQGLRTPEFGYGLVYGTVFDEDSYDLPYRYTQLVVKGLENTVKDNERYVLRFMRDFSLREELPSVTSLYSPLYLKNIHWEWKLIREKQLAKIDLHLWEKIIEAMIGKRVENGIINQDVILPSLNREVYDQLFNKDTRYGFGEEQVLMDKDTAIYIIENMLNDTSKKYKNVDINVFLSNYTFDDENSIVAMMYDLYNSFATDEINNIFFEILHASLSFKKEHPDIFKTSWVALQVVQNVQIPSNSILREQTFINGECGQ